MKVTIELNDTLEERVESAIDSVKTELMDYLEANPDQDELPCLNNDLDYSGAIHEIVDGATPCYTKELADNYYLHDSELDQAFDNAGCSTRDEAGDNYIAQAHYFYIQEQVNEWYQDEAQALFDEWVAERTFKAEIIQDSVNGDLVTFIRVTKDSDVIFPLTAIDELIEDDIMDDREDLEGLRRHLIADGQLPKDARLED